VTTIIRINQVGRVANHMAQLMFARALERKCSQSLIIEGYDLPDWNLRRNLSGSGCELITVGSHLTRADWIALMIDKFKPPVVNLDGVILREGNLRGLAFDDLFPLPEGEVSPAENALVIHIRLGDVAKFSHPHYGPIPISFYRYILDRTGLSPIFIGELSDCPYFDALQKAFPCARYLLGGSVKSDFQTIRSAKNIAISVSSFAWLAAFLSKAKQIHVPIAGMLNPKVRPDVDMLPLCDGRFMFHKIPEKVWLNRYEDAEARAATYQMAHDAEVKMIKRIAIGKTALINLRIHLGLAKRMLNSRKL
jgi:hypothetical protein